MLCMLLWCGMCCVWFDVMCGVVGVLFGCGVVR